MNNCKSTTIERIFRKGDKKKIYHKNIASPKIIKKSEEVVAKKNPEISKSNQGGKSSYIHKSENTPKIIKKEEPVSKVIKKSEETFTNNNNINLDGGTF